MSIEILPVIFRKGRTKETTHEITAVFPTLPADMYGHELTIYAHIGQHGGASFNWYFCRTKKALPHEYADLLQELRRIYERSLAPGDPVFSLKVYQKMTAQHRKAFNAEARRLRQMMANGNANCQDKGVIRND